MVAWIVAMAAFGVIGFSMVGAVRKLGNDDCTTVTQTLANGTIQTFKSCS